MFNNRPIDSKFVSTNNSLESGAAAATGKFLNQVKSVPKNIELASAGGGLVPQLNKGQQNQSSSTVKTGSDVSPNVTSPPSGTSLDSNSELPTDTLSGVGRFDHQPTLSISFFGSHQLIYISERRWVLFRKLDLAFSAVCRFRKH